MPGLIVATVAICPGAVSSPSRSVKRTVRVEPGHRAEARREVGVADGELAGRRHLAAPGPVDPPLPASDRAVDERDHALGQAGQLLGLEPLAEVDAGHVEHGVPDPVGQAMVDRRRRRCASRWPDA